MIKVENTQGIELDRKILDMAIHLSYLFLKRTTEFPTMDAKKACLEGKSFLEKNFSLHPVLYRSIKEVEIFGSEAHTPEEIASFVQNSEKRSPFKIPLGFTETQGGKVIEYFPFGENKSKLETIFSGILLEKSQR